MTFRRDRQAAGNVFSELRAGVSAAPSEDPDGFLTVISVTPLVLEPDEFVTVRVSEKVFVAAGPGQK